jgi:transposase-like protein
VSRARKYDWPSIREFHEAGHSAGECQRRFGISNGAWHHAVRKGVIQPRPEDVCRKPRGATRAQVKQLLDRGLTQAEIAAQLGVSRPTVCFHMRRLGVRTRAEFGRRYNWDEIRAFYDEGHSRNECMRRFGFSRNAWADAVKRGRIEPRPRRIPTKLMLVNGSGYNRYHLKARLLTEGLKLAECERCGVKEWEGEPLAFELHHINGDGRDNRLENLQLLCPNCHSQTDTWGGRNKGRQDGLRAA